jgi:hypothetical protein
MQQKLLWKFKSSLLIDYLLFWFDVCIIKKLIVLDLH